MEGEEKNNAADFVLQVTLLSRMRAGYSRVGLPIMDRST